MFPLPKALLIIDMQAGFMRQGCEDLVPKIARLAGFFPENAIFQLRYRNYPGSAFARFLDWQECTDSQESALLPEMEKIGGHIYDHWGYLPPPELVQALKPLAQVGICGVDTDACVMAACFALWDAEIRPWILADYCFSSGGKPLHQAALDLMRRQFGGNSILSGEYRQ